MLYSDTKSTRLTWSSVESFIICINPIYAVQHDSLIVRLACINELRFRTSNATLKKLTLSSFDIHEPRFLKILLLCYI